MDHGSTVLPSIDGVAAACFAELEALTVSNQEIPADLLASFHLLYGPKIFGKALEALDHSGSIVCFAAQPSGRKVYQVQGRQAGDRYLVFPNHYCSCQAFLHGVVGKSDAPCCKHQLACRLAGCLRKLTLVPVSDLDVAHMLLQHIAASPSTT